MRKKKNIFAMSGIKREIMSNLPNSIPNLWYHFSHHTTVNNLEFKAAFAELKEDGLIVRKRYSCGTNWEKKK